MIEATDRTVIWALQYDTEPDRPHPINLLLISVVRVDRERTVMAYAAENIRGVTQSCNTRGKYL
jgi:hypothetical protein